MAVAESEPATRRGLRVGLQLNTTQREFRWSEIADLARAAEASGLDSLWTEDHLFYRTKSGATTGPWDPWSVLGGLAAVTERVRLGALVSPLPLRGPLPLAHHAATVDEMSDGRFVLGIGAGWNAAEYAAVGAPFDHRIARFEEALEVMLQLFDSGSASFQGEYLVMEGSLMPANRVRRRPELMVGSVAPRLLRAALPHVDAWNWDGFFLDLEDFANDQKVMREACAVIGRDPREIAVSGHLIARLSGAEGLPIDPLPEGKLLLGGSVAELADGFRALSEAGLDEVQLIVDPARTKAIETIGRAAEMARG